MFGDLAVFLATGCGIANFLPASVGALLGCPLALLSLRLSFARQLAFILICLVAATILCDRAAVELGAKDPPTVVADEYLTFPVAVFGLARARHPALLAGAFLTSRILDGVKPPPARQAEALAGGLGIVVDDVISNLYALALHALLGFFIRRPFRRRGTPPSED